MHCPCAPLRAACPAGSMFDPHLVPAYLAHLEHGQKLGVGKQQVMAAAEPAEQQQPGPGMNGRIPAKRRLAGGKQGRRQKRRRGAGEQRAAERERQAEAEEAEAAEAAVAHLAELELGFCKDSLLGPWLRLLLQQEAEQGPPPGQQPDSQVWQLAQQWTDVPAWRLSLEAACHAAGLPPPQHRHELLPLATGWCLVFEARLLLAFAHLLCPTVCLPATE